MKATGRRNSSGGTNCCGIPGKKNEETCHRLQRLAAAPDGWQPPVPHPKTWQEEPAPAEFFADCSGEALHGDDKGDSHKRYEGRPLSGSARDEHSRRRCSCRHSGGADISFDPQCGQRGSSIGWRDPAETAPETSATAWGDCRWDAISEAECRRCGSGCPALGASGPTPIGRTGAAVGCELFVWLDRPITTAVAAAPRQAYGSTLNGRLQAHRSEGRAETTLDRNREPNRSIGHWLAFGW